MRVLSAMMKSESHESSFYQYSNSDGCDNGIGVGSERIEKNVEYIPPSPNNDDALGGTPNCDICSLEPF